MALASRSFYSSDSDERKIFLYERSPFTSVSLGAMTYKPTNRITNLSKPKIKKDTTVREGFSRYASDPTYSGVTASASRAICSNRVAELAEPLKRTVSYAYELPLPRPVPRPALKYEATPRVAELAEPKKVLGA